MGIHQKPLQTTTKEKQNCVCVYIYIYIYMYVCMYVKWRVDGGCGGNESGGE